jgi:signal transduction histidine kinase
MELPWALLSRKLLTQLEGEIFVKSENGKGSEFYIEIPL